MRHPTSLMMIVTSEMTATTLLGGFLEDLRAQGFDVTIVASSDGQLEQFASAEGVQAVSVRMRREPSPLADLKSLASLTSLLYRRRPEMVVVATPKASLLGMLAATLTRVPVRVYQVWGLRIETEHGPRRVLLEALERLTLRLATHIAANSPSLAEEVRRLAPSKRVDVIGHGSSHGIDLARFDRRGVLPELPEEARSQFRDGRLVVGTIGRVHRDKGTLTLLGAMRTVAANRPSTLLVVGPSEDEATEQELQKEQGALRVVRIGRVADPRAWFAVMDIHALPTLREGFPNVVLEASALHVPTVTTTATGARDSVLDGVTGLVVPPADPLALAQAIESLAGDRDARERMGAAARARVEQHFEQRQMWRLQGEYLKAARGERTA